uniref:hypothetical protein n=2 Tax=Gammaproteobacteria TaxID=1236 RepID=UPI003EB88AF5
MAAPWISSPEMAMRDPGQGGRHRQTWRWSTPARIVGCGDASSRSVATAGDLVPSSAMAMLQLDVRGLVVSASSDARCSSEAKKNRLGVSEAASLHAVQGGRNRAGDQGGKPRGLMCSSATLAGFFDLSDASGPPWALLDLLLLFLDVLLLLVLLLVARTVAKLAMRQPFVLFKGLTFQKLCLPGAFRPGITIIKC